MRKPFQSLLLSAILLLGALALCQGAQRPNVLFIMADDLRPQLGCYGDTVVRTPQIDEFAGTALRFNRAYVQSAICSPSRNSMLSGLRPNTTGLRGFGVTLRDVLPDVVTLPQYFMQHGYHTQAFGKIFHIYDESMLGDENDPQSWSAPLQWPTAAVWGPEQNALRNQLIEKARADGVVFNHPHDWPRAETWDDSDLPDDQMQDGQTASMAVDFLKSRRGDGEPFFLAVGFLRPHLPFNAPRKYWDLYDPASLRLPEFRDLPEGAPAWAVNRGIVSNYYNMPEFRTIDNAFLRRYLQAYLACISYVDACFGRVMDALNDSGHAEDTIVVFLGDHGYQMGEYDSWGHKHSNFEISVRAPLLIRAPNMERPGGIWQGPVEFLDLYPSLCELAELDIPKSTEGKSFAALFRDQMAILVKETACSEMFRRGRLGRSIRNPDFRYTEWRNAAGELVARELYDHRDGSFLETRNVMGQESHHDQVAKLSAQLHELVPHDKNQRD